MAKLKIHGNTKAIRSDLKRDGYRWEPGTASWVREVTDEQAAAIMDDATRQATLTSLHGRKKGCCTYLGTVEVYRSPSYQAQDAPMRGDSDNCDAAGNYVPGARIPGSAPEDRI
jgi:hypothetical protein